MKKILLSLCLLAGCSLSAFSQTEYSGSYDIYGLGSDKSSKVKKITHNLEAGFGNEFQIGYKVQLNFNKYLAWDMLGVQYTYDYGDDCYDLEDGGYNYNAFDVTHEIGLTTGLRAFLPLSNSVKLFAAYNMGVVVITASEFECDGDSHGYYGDEEYSTEPHFLADFSVGIYVAKKWSLAYGFQNTSAGAYSHKDHTFRVGFTF